ncbi:MAG: 16S rRNA processing protein RimM [Myxococcales bacterium]|nr:16S rRNA processing protein RimM [Myxococcales bacterium]
MNTLELGRVLGPHGLRGELKVRLHWQGSTALLDAESVEIGAGAASRPYQVEWARPGPHGVLVKLVGIDDRDAASALGGAPLSVPRSALPPLEPGEYYLSDLVGAEVVGPDGHVGEVVEVRTHPSVDCLAVRLPDGRVLEQPLSAPWVEAVDAQAGRVVLSSTEGLV